MFTLFLYAYAHVCILLKLMSLNILRNRKDHVMADMFRIILIKLARCTVVNRYILGIKISLNCVQVGCLLNNGK